MLPTLGKENRNYGCAAQDHSPSREPAFKWKIIVVATVLMTF